ncbi:hypothetical protein A8C56_19690 [Niabella ginsenosidivorans]|uniref:Uncharacterized protein n=1 Tax=Niabella ginsenosidivorans TaxID=1176587 RepID=A0A1A9I8A5_9BACT|nr:hypothetical protein [Niabella ginsenosidivorans]ANH82911.1 hypothetical protein A8C56_19690 [Niabella ginsenosidivorans]
MLAKNYLVRHNCKTKFPEAGKPVIKKLCCRDAYNHHRGIWRSFGLKAASEKRKTGSGKQNPIALSMIRERVALINQTTNKKLARPFYAHDYYCFWRL